MTAEAGLNHELADMTRRFWIGLALTLPVFVLEMSGHIPALDFHRLVSPAISMWIQFVFSTPVVLWAGWPFFQRGWASVISRHLNMFTLIALGTGTAYSTASRRPSLLGCFQLPFTAWAAPLPFITRRRR